MTNGSHCMHSPLKDVACNYEVDGVMMDRVASSTRSKDHRFLLSNTSLDRVLEDTLEEGSSYYTLQAQAS